MPARVFALLVAPLILGISLSLPAVAQPARTHTVQQVALDGKSVETAAATVTPRSGKSETAIRRGETIVDGTRIDVPAHLVVVIASFGEKSTVILQPGSSITFVSTGSGELVRNNGGKTIFSVVPQSLDFFRVQSGEALTASVHGTEFSVDASDGSVAYACTSGEVNITKSGYLLIGTVPTEVSLIDVVSAAARSQAAYKPTAHWVLASFANFAEAESFFRANLAEAQKSGDANAVNAALRNLSRVQRNQGRFEDALLTGQQAVALSRQLGDREGEALALESVANTENSLRRSDDAEKASEQALALFRALGDRDGEANTLVDAGFIAVDQRRVSDATVAEEQALLVFRELGDRLGEAQALRGIGTIDLIIGQTDDALKSYGAALQIYRSLNDRERQAKTLSGMSKVEFRLKMNGDARTFAQQALTLYQQLGDRAGESEMKDLIAHGNPKRTRP